MFKVLKKIDFEEAYKKLIDPSGPKRTSQQQQLLYDF